MWKDLDEQHVCQELLPIGAVAGQSRLLQIRPFGFHSA